MEFVDRYLQMASRIIAKVDRSEVCRMIDVLKKVKKNHGRIFFLGVGGSAANASHAVNDFRKICGFEAYTPVDNVSELSARVAGLDDASLNRIAEQAGIDDEALAGGADTVVISVTALLLILIIIILLVK